MDLRKSQSGNQFTQIDFVSVRKRIKNAINQGSYNDLSDIELLTALLSPTHPHIDVTPIATNLIKKFGTFANVINADPEEMISIPNISTAAVDAIQFTATIYKETVKRGKNSLPLPQIRNTNQAINWLQQTQSDCFGYHAFFLNGKNNILAHKFYDIKMINTPDLGVSIIKLSLTNSATGLIILRLTENMETTPDSSDLSLGIILEEKGQNLGINLHDFIIVNDTRHYSIRHAL